MSAQTEALAKRIVDGLLAFLAMLALVACTGALILFFFGRLIGKAVGL